MGEEAPSQIERDALADQRQQARLLQPRDDVDDQHRGHDAEYFQKSRNLLVEGDPLSDLADQRDVLTERRPVEDVVDQKAQGQGREQIEQESEQDQRQDRSE